MMPGDRLPDSPRAAVNHHPQALVGVGLELEKMVAPPQRAQLHPAIPLG